MDAMIEKTLRVLRWATAGAVGIALTIWLVAVAFALLGFRRTAEAISETLFYVLPIALALLALLVAVSVAAAVLRWISGRSNTSR